MNDNTEIQITIDEVHTLEGGRYSVSGRCAKGPIRVGDRFDAVLDITIRKSPQEWVVAAEHAIATVELVVKRIYCFGYELEELDQREALADFEYLLGKRGHTTTPLNPSGKASFGDDVVSVISDGEPIGNNVAVYVADVHGNRVLVKQTDNTTG